MVEIADRQAFEDWLADKPREVAVLLAARSALRILPLWPGMMPDVVDRHRANVLLPHFRATAVALFAGTWRNRATGKVIDAAAAADFAASAYATADATAYGEFAVAADFAAITAARADFTAAASAAASAAAYAAAYAGDAATIWSALSLDCTALDAAAETREATDWPSILALLGKEPLWPAATLTLDPDAARGAPPDWVGETWPRLKSDLLAVEGEDWQVWTDWYQARLDGGPYDPDLEQARVLLPKDLWEKGPAAVNAHIRGLIEARAAPTPEQIAQKVPIARTIEIDRATGTVTSRPPAERTQAPGEITNTAIVANLRRKLARHLARFAAKPPQYRLDTVLDTVRGAVDADNDQPEIIHDDCEEALIDLRALIAVGDLPELRTAPELAALERDLNRAVSDLRTVYPQLDRMAQARRTVRMRPLTPEEQDALVRMIDAFESIVDERLTGELRADLDAAIAEVEEPPRPDLPLPEGPAKHRLYDLSGMLARIARFARMRPEDLKKLFDAGMAATKRVRDFERAWETVKPYWDSLKDWWDTLSK